MVSVSDDFKCAIIQQLYQHIYSVVVVLTNEVTNQNQAFNKAV